MRIDSSSRWTGTYLSFKTGRCAYDRYSDGQRPSRPQSSVIVIIRPCDPGWYPIVRSTLQTKSHKPKLGLFASSTPFVTGRPYTLIFNGSVKSSGAVGLALSGGSRPVAETAFPGLRAITAPLKVTQYVPHSITIQSPLPYTKSKHRSKGNLINELDNTNPTALLVSAIEKSALAGNTARDDEFYLGVLRDDGDLWQLHHILAGGPSRGTMALDTETAPGEGTSVQVCRH